MPDYTFDEAVTSRMQNMTDNMREAITQVAIALRPISLAINDWLVQWARSMKTYRKEAGMTPSEMARFLHMSTRDYRRMERRTLGKLR